MSQHRARVRSTRSCSASLSEKSIAVPNSRMSRHLAIVPALNEAGSIAQTVTEIHQHAAGFDVLVVDDGSVDETA